MPKISVIVPTYNTAKYLPRCLDSILNQTFLDFEIIIVSDGPEADNRIAEEYAKKDNRITVLKNIKKGLGGARNAGLKIAKGEFISFIDSDDWVEKAFLELMYNAIVTNKSVDIVQCGTNIVFEGEINQELKKNDDNYFNISNEGCIDINSDIFGTINVGSWNKLYRKSLIDRYKLKFPINLKNEDAYFTWVYWSISKQMYCIPLKLYNYLRRDSSLMAKTFAKQLGKSVLDHFTVGILLYKFLKKQHLFKQNEIAFYKALNVCYWFVKDNADSKYKEIGYNKLRSFLKHKKVPDTFEELRLIRKYPYKDFINESVAKDLKPIKSFKWLEQIFSIKNTEDKSHKVITVLGLKLKIKKTNN